MEQPIKDIFGQLNLLLNNKLKSILNNQFNGEFELIGTSENLYPLGIAGKLNYRLYQLIDETGAIQSTGFFQLLNQSYATLCQQLYQNIFYTISPTDQQLFLAANIAASPSAGSRDINHTPPGSLLTYLTEQAQSGSVEQLNINQITKKLLPVSQAAFRENQLEKILLPENLKKSNGNFTRISPSAPSRLAYQDYLNNFGVITDKISKLLQDQETANNHLNTLKLAIINPVIGQGGINLTNNTLVPAYQSNFPTTNKASKALLASIQNTSRSLTIGFDYSWDDATNTYQLTWHESKQISLRPIQSNRPMLSIKVGQGRNSQALNLEEASNLKISFSISYPGITLIPIAPDNHWYDEQVFKQVVVHQQNQTTGYQFLTSQFSVEQVFGPNGSLRGMRQLVISGLPEIRIIFENMSYDDYIKKYPANGGISVQIGSLNIANSSAAYLAPVFKNDSPNSKTSGFTIQFKPQPFPSDLPLTDYPAFLLGATVSLIPLS